MRPLKWPAELLEIDQMTKEGVEVVPSKPTKIFLTMRLWRPLMTWLCDDLRLCWLRHCVSILKQLVFGFLERVPWKVSRQTPETPRLGGDLKTWLSNT